MHIQINFDNEIGIFQPGEQITGTVQVNCDGDVPTKGVKLKFKGSAEVSWTESEGSGNEVRDVTRSADETYYKSEMMIFGGGEEQVLPPGTHNFPFTFVLPMNVPGSFEGKSGSVEHSCKAKLIRDWKFDKKCTRKFSVNPMYDLNIDPKACESISLNQHKTLCCWCCKSGPISFVLRIDHSGYVCGEPLIINAECSNKSNRNIGSTTAEVIQKITFIAGGYTTSDSRIVCKLEHGEISKGEDDIWSQEQLVVPTVPPSKLPGCSIIDITYTFKFTMTPNGPAGSLSKTVPLIIGTVPLGQVYTNFFGGANMAIHNGMPPTAPPLGFSGQGQNLPGAFPNLPQPTFAKTSYSMATYSCVTHSDSSHSDSSDDETERRERMPFVPVYPSYNFCPGERQHCHNISHKESDTSSDSSHDQPEKCHDSSHVEIETGNHKSSDEECDQKEKESKEDEKESKEGEKESKEGEKEPKEDEKESKEGEKESEEEVKESDEEAEESEEEAQESEEEPEEEPAEESEED